MIFKPFHPPHYLKPAYMQTMLASMRIRCWGKNAMQQGEEPLILETDSGTRLLGYHTPQKNTPLKGLVILLHGWEGSAHSTYMLSCGKHFFSNGFAVFRLNFRDHGPSHHLNEGLFYATLLDEVIDAVQQISAMSNGTPVFLVGFSLGGNFAMRIAARYPKEKCNHLSKVVSISPVLNPDKATDRIDHNPLILNYFLKKWRRSLLLKQQLFSKRYDFGDILRMRTLRKMTASLLNRYSHYASAEEYFHDYGIHAQDTQGITLPLTIITAEDDPIIPVDDFYDLKLGAGSDLIVHNYGGHNGFLEGLFKPAWYDHLMVSLFTK